MTAAFVTGIYFLYRWSEDHSPLISGEKLGENSKWKWAVLAGIFLGFAAFVKIVIAFFVGAAAIAMVLFTLGKGFWKSKQVWTMAALMVLPALVFYVFLNQGRSTEYFFSWTVALIQLISSTDFYNQWLVFIGRLFGLTVLFASITGAFIAPSRMRWLLVSLWIGYLLYGLTLPFQMYTHSYYHIQLIPIVALGLAAVLDPVTERAAGISGVGRVGLVAVVGVVIGYHAYVAQSVLVAESFRHEPAYWNEVGNVIPTDGKVIALTHDYGYRLMMYGWRKVNLWPLATGLSEVRNPGKNNAEEFEELTAGMDYFLVTAFGQLDKQPDLKTILETYPVVDEGDGYVLYDLR